MTFESKISKARQIIDNNINILKTEQATKDSLIRPVLNALGYDTFDPDVVVPEYTCDFGIKQGEKVDFAIFFNGKPEILIECKHHKIPLDSVVLAQLHRYYTTTDARLGILTNGVVYRFFTDTEKSNIIDNTPFLEINLADQNENLWEKFRPFAKENYNPENIRDMAVKLKNTSIIRDYIKNQLQKPSDSFIKFMISELKLFSGKLSDKVINQYRSVCEEALKDITTNSITSGSHVPVVSSAKLPENQPVAVSQDFTGMKPEKFIFLGKEHIVKNWRDILVEISYEIYLRHKDKFNKVFEIKGKTRDYFSADQKLLKDAVNIGDSGIFAEGNLNTNNIVNICKRLLVEFGYSETDLKIEVKQL
ncbi:MAG: type I restriction enzyme HsdR N-terminal domain-containing protein [Firmicutes bacterium]|nr:type I restriction enzyme HsdR N-terminal domain-containing protein [Bacillota bacterium]